MDKIKQKESVRIAKKRGINHLLRDNNTLVKYSPWIGSLFSFLYDKIMEKSVFPKKFNAGTEEHYKILRDIFKDLSGKTIIEFACGSGDAVKFLHNDNYYAGVDISLGLLHLANKKFNKSGFVNAELYYSDACNTPFQDSSFEVAICNLSLNFFRNIDNFITELKRILKPIGIFYCSVPIPERKITKTKINGTLYKLDELKRMFVNKNFNFEPLPYTNGALLYFKATISEFNQME